ncbi:response regulator transcription factor [Sulfurospirillum sp. 1612]|uniref:response regulator transcription factor n=1 Tax=Sulfurospirillum sp. 1612 TaxID=3094835 RepID=UPI002F93AA9B
MSTHTDVEKLKKVLNNFTVLYIEKNENLKTKVGSFLSKIFSKTYITSHAQEGLELFEQHHPAFVISCIQLEDMDGLKLAKKLRNICPKVRIIITSSKDDKDHLLEAINLHVDGYLMKPFRISSLAKLLHSHSEKMLEELNHVQFNQYMYKIFNKQQNLIALIRDDHLVLTNETFLNFFGLKTQLELRERAMKLDEILLPHPNFLYRKEDDTKSCLEKIKQNIDRLYNIKIHDTENVEHHFILKLASINENNDAYILSLTDITPLNLLGLYAKKRIEDDTILSNKETILHLFNAAKEADATIKLYNFYKGLMISSDGKIIETSLNHYTFKTSINQLKSVRFEQKTVIHCDLFPFDIESSDIKDINFAKQTIEAENCSMLKTTPSERKSLILEPDEHHSVSLVFREKIYDQEMYIKDMSKEAVKISLPSIPEGMAEEDEIYISLSFKDQPKPTIIRTKARVFKILPHKEAFYIIADFVPTAPSHKAIVNYLISRQMTLVREFKGLSI